MRNILCLVVALGLVSTAAFGQADIEPGSYVTGSARALTGPKLLLSVEAGDNSPEGLAVAKALRKEMDHSRTVMASYGEGRRAGPIDDSRVPLLVAPLTVTKDATGENTTVKIELHSRGNVETREVACPVAKPATCARHIAAAAKKFALANNTRAR
jgi:hypothetical protein